MADRRELTRDGAIAIVVSAVLLAFTGTVAIVTSSWQVAAIGALWAAAVLVAGQLADRIL